MAQEGVLQVADDGTHAQALREGRQLSLEVLNLLAILPVGVQLSLELVSLSLCLEGGSLHLCVHVFESCIGFFQLPNLHHVVLQSG